jgi:putative transposase
MHDIAVCFSHQTMPTHAVTTVTHQRRALFQQTANAQLLQEQLFHYRDQGRYQLHGFVIMPDHLHLLLTPAVHQTLAICMMCIKGGFSHAVKKQFTGEVWQTGYHEHRIRNPEDFQNQLNYIAANPERRGLAKYEFVHSVLFDRIDPMPHEFPGR